ncbi:MAG TPA: hypothetical protein DEF47_01270 [Herpetosiphon sp.]|uniref:hypothetical protein n=1 Tax=Herpetosiphon sp. TaxID=71864 RepID=UPI00059C9836|nr:hypothetical protein [Herpetosiphon sp.]HBW48517.1 hypothetical protein [Herpetosiphon sp.]
MIEQRACLLRYQSQPRDHRNQSDAAGDAATMDADAMTGAYGADETKHDVGDYADDSNTHSIGSDWDFWHF